MIVYSHTFLHKNVFIPPLGNFTLIYGPFSCLNNVLFGPIFMGNVVLFSNAHSILELMLCNRNLPKLDILTLLSSNCRAWAFKIEQEFEKWTKYVFIFILPTPELLKRMDTRTHVCAKFSRIRAKFKLLDMELAKQELFHICGTIWLGFFKSYRFLWQFLCRTLHKIWSS